MPLYFAYGSNMDRAAMAARCPGATALGPARLVRHCFIVNTDGYAAVRRDPHRVVWGLLWDLALADVPALDRYESLATGLYTKTVQPVLAAAGPRRALVYLARSSTAGAARAGYMENVVAAATAADLPEAYRRELEAWLPNPPPGAAEKPAVRPLFAAPSGLRGRPRT